jgi:hypothetical protein
MLIGQRVRATKGKKRAIISLIFSLFGKLMWPRRRESSLRATRRATERCSVRLPPWQAVPAGPLFRNGGSRRVAFANGLGIGAALKVRDRRVATSLKGQQREDISLKSPTIVKSPL